MDIKDRTDEAIQITYMNHQGKIAERRIIPIKLWFGKTEWYPEPQWLMKAWDRDKEAERDFAVKRIVCPKVADHNEQTKRINELEPKLKYACQRITQLETDLDQAIAWVREREDEWDDEKDVLLCAMADRLAESKKERESNG